MTKVLYINQHVRRAPLDPYAAVRAAKTEQLAGEVNDYFTAMLNEALRLALEGDAELAAMRGGA